MRYVVKHENLRDTYQVCKYETGIYQKMAIAVKMY